MKIKLMVIIKEFSLEIQKVELPFHFKNLNRLLCLEIAKDIAIKLYLMVKRLLGIMKNMIIMIKMLLFILALKNI